MSKIKIDFEPIKWLLLEDDFFGVSIHIEARKQEDQYYKYAVTSGGSFFLEGTIGFCMASKDDEDFKKKTRHKTFELALDSYKKYVEYCLSKKAKDSYQMAIQYKYNNKIVNVDNEKLLEKINNRKSD